MRVLITGGAGFIGSHLALRLIAEGHAVTVLDSLSPQIHGTEPSTTSPLYQSIQGKVRFVLGSVCDERALADALHQQEVVAHLAAETGTGQSMYEVHRYAEINVGGTARLLDVLARGKHKVGRLLVASSRAIYGEGKYETAAGVIVYPGGRTESDMQAGRFEPIDAVTGEVLRAVATDEDSKIHPSSVYGITKQAQEQLVLTVGPAIGIESVALRYQNVYGPGQSLKNPYTGILSIFSTRILNGNSIDVFEDGKESRDFVYIDDVVEATALGLFKAEAAGQAIGVGSGAAADVLTVARTLVASYDREVPIKVTGAYRVGDIRHNFADTAKARRLLGFAARTDFAAGIARFTDWVREQEVAEDSYEASIRELTEKGLFRK